LWTLQLTLNALGVLFEGIGLFWYIRSLPSVKELERWNRDTADFAQYGIAIEDDLEGQRKNEYII